MRGSTPEDYNVYNTVLCTLLKSGLKEGLPNGRSLSFWMPTFILEANAIQMLYLSFLKTAHFITFSPKTLYLRDVATPWYEILTYV